MQKPTKSASLGGTLLSIMRLSFVLFVSELFLRGGFHSTLHAGGLTHNGHFTISADTLWTREYGSARLRGDNKGDLVRTDKSGGVFVVGTSQNAGGHSDIITFKYDSIGDELWSARYDEPTAGQNTPADLIIDSAGNVIVVGTSYQENVGTDLIVLKYDPFGALVWVRHAPNASSGGSSGIALELGSNGAIYALGSIAGTGTSLDFLLIKYDTHGGLQWSRTYDGVSHLHDTAVDLKVDAGECIYVTGSIAQLSTSLDIATIKYDSAGQLQWERIYDGPGHIDDYPVVLTIDNDGQVLVVGTSRDVQIGYDFVLLKYDANGDTTWLRRYDGLGHGDDLVASAAVSQASDIYVLGSSTDEGNSKRITTVKYNSKGEMLWMRKHDESDVYHDEAAALSLDSSHSVYVTGTADGDLVTIRYDTSGIELWTRSYGGNTYGGSKDISVSPYGKIYVTGGNRSDCVTLRYDFDGALAWEKRYVGPAQSYDQCTAQSVDSDGNVFIAGSSVGTETGQDFLTVKFDADGRVVWSNWYDGAGLEDKAIALVMDKLGNVFVTGYSIGSDSSLDIVTIKYNPTGGTEWVNRFAGPNKSADFPYAMSTDASGNVYVGGRSSTDSTSFDYCLVKISSVGETIWVRQYDGGGEKMDIINSIAVDGIGNIVVTGRSGSPSSPSDYATIKYNAQGDTLWVQRYEGPGNGADFAQSVAVDSAGGVFVTGLSDSSGINAITTISYSTDGNLIWVNRYHGLPGTVHNGPRIAVTSGGEIYVAGGSSTSNSRDMITLRYTRSGDIAWERSYGRVDFAYATLRFIATDERGAVYVSGSRTPQNGLPTLLTAKYSAAGELEWSDDFGTGEVYTSGGLALATNGELFVTATKEGHTSKTITIIKYRTPRTTNISEGASAPAGLQLSQNYPNPFNPSTRIRYAIASQGPVTLTIYDLLGRLVQTLVNTHHASGNYEVTFLGSSLPSGVYVCKLQSGNLSSIRRMLLLK